MRSYSVIRILVVLLVGLGIAYYFYSKFSELKDNNKQLSIELKGLEKEWVKLRQQQGEMAYTNQKVTEIQEQLSSVQSEVATLRQLVGDRRNSVLLLEDASQKIFARHRAAVWKAARHERFDQIVTPQGGIYNKVIVIEVRPKEVSFMFGEGAKGHGLTLDKLPKIWIEKYMYTPAEVKAAQVLAAARKPPLQKKRAN